MWKFKLPTCPKVSKTVKYYKTLIYDGNLDIIYNHSDVLDMIADLSWSGADAYSGDDEKQTENKGR